MKTQAFQQQPEGREMFPVSISSVGETGCPMLARPGYRHLRTVLDNLIDCRVWGRTIHLDWSQE
jgi:hypothetical protein